MESYKILSKILGVDVFLLEELDAQMSERTGRVGVIEKLCRENQKIINLTLERLNSKKASAPHVRSMLRKTIYTHEAELLRFLEIIEGKNRFEKAAALAKQIARVGSGFFLKKDRAKGILMKRKPENLLKFLKVSDIEEAVKKYDVAELFSVLRFVESDEWMHKTFDEAYSGFTPQDFEERDIEIKVLGPEWREISREFVAKKHHNVSHLKEFGVIFLNPVSEDIPGKFLRDFALLLHYFHEIDFYSKFFKMYAENSRFAEKLKALLRGDVPEIYKISPGEWLIVQRYLYKENSTDPRLYLPRVNPESLHWLRGERDLALFKTPEAKLDLNLWHDLDWIGGIFEDGGEEVVSFDLEDNAMSLVSFMEGKNEVFNYHQREAMWTKMFSDYVGGEENMEKLLSDNFEKGVIKF